MLRVSAKALHDLHGRHAMPPMSRQEFDREPEALGDPFPQRREMARLSHEHLITWRERVGQRRFPRACPRRWVDDYRAFGPEYSFHPRDHGLRQCGEFRAAMV